MSSSETITGIMKPCAIVSFCFCAIPRYLQMMFLIFFSDLIFASGGLDGGTAACDYQYICSNYFPVYSCLLAMIVMRELYHTICTTKPTKPLTYVKCHIAAAVIPLVWTLMPLSTCNPNCLTIPILLLKQDGVS